LGVVAVFPVDRLGEDREESLSPAGARENHDGEVRLIDQIGDMSERVGLKILGKVLKSSIDQTIALMVKLAEISPIEPRTVETGRKMSTAAVWRATVTAVVPASAPAER
jgi:hypothetical protein